MRAPDATSAGMVPTIDPSTFPALAARPGILVVDFTARWCGPCKTLDPVLAGLASEYADHVTIVAIDVDDAPHLAQQLDVRSMPTVVVLRDGSEVGRMIGSRPRAFVAGVLDRALAGDSAIASP